MTAKDAKRAYADACLKTAYLNADDLADRLGVTYATRQALHLRTIGSIDVRKGDRERLRRARYSTKRKQKAADKPAKLELSARERTMLVKTGRSMDDLTRKARRSRLFRDLEDGAERGAPGGRQVGERRTPRKTERAARPGRPGVLPVARGDQNTRKPCGIAHS